MNLSRKAWKRYAPIFVANCPCDSWIVTVRARSPGHHCAVINKNQPLHFAAFRKLHHPLARFSMEMLPNL
jgi:hypothetical protein